MITPAVQVQVFMYHSCACCLALLLRCILVIRLGLTSVEGRLHLDQMKI
jgi:hypothetical protein